MIDESDIDDAIVMTIVSGGGGWFPTLLGFLLIAIVYMCMRSNTSDCAKKSCPNGMQPRLLDHACLCIEPAEEP